MKNKSAYSDNISLFVKTTNIALFFSPIIQVELHIFIHTLAFLKRVYFAFAAVIITGF